ncbi:50S ribosomal protein L9 [Candidatus Uhrbacteria bacterium]|nr:50S ribosomal protein L9 [Candidatus Uhrbacteria bacterium]
MKIKIILLQNVPDLGDKDDVVEVAEGHARNFLIPKGLGILATPDTLRARDERKAAAVHTAETELKHVQKLAEQLDGIDVIIEAKVSEEGTLYAAVTQERIAKELSVMGYSVDATWILVPEAIKEEGEYDVQLHLPHGLEAIIKVIIKGV